MDETHGRFFDPGDGGRLAESRQHGVVVPSIPIRLVPGGKMPVRAHENDACLDCFCRIEQEAVLVAPHCLKIPLGFCVNVPAGWEARLRCRSGVALRGAIVHHGTIDSSFTGEVNAIVTVAPGFRLHICPGDRLAQLTFAPVYRPRFELVDELPPCRGGFGSTGR